MGLRKNDVLLIIAIAAAAFLFHLYNSTKPVGGFVSIYADGRLYGKYSLSENRVIELRNDENHFNLIEIRDSMISVIDADCSDRACVRHGAVSKRGAAIICVPNRVSVKVEGQISEIDAVVW